MSAKNSSGRRDSSHGNNTPKTGLLGLINSNKSTGQRGRVQSCLADNFTEMVKEEHEDDEILPISTLQGRRR